MTVGGILPALSAAATEHLPEATTTRTATSNKQGFSCRHSPCYQPFPALQAFETINFFSYLPITHATGSGDFLSFPFNNLYMAQQIQQGIQTGQG